MRVFGLLVLGTAMLAACSEDGGSYVLGDGGFTPKPDTGAPIPPPMQVHGGNTGPMVELKNVTPINDPLVGPVLTGGSLEVVCEAKQRARGTAVDLTSVRVQLLDSAGKVIDEAPLAAKGIDTFTGSVSLGKVPTGPVRVRCSAKDTTTTPITNFGEVATFYDGGPAITFQGLDENSIVPRGSLDKDNEIDFTINFKVDPSELAPGDPGAAVANVVLKVRDTIVSPTRDGDAYSYSVDFKALVGTMTIPDLKISISATNARTPAATATEDLIVKVDGTPPTIDVMSPVDKSIVGGRVTAMLTITDDLSGVATNEKLTFATIGDKGSMNKVDRALVRVGNSNVYTFDFEATEFPGVSIIPINITAVDNVGNRASKALDVKFDTVPPYVTLSSPLVRECNKMTKRCSAPFRVSGDTPQDRAIILANARFRVSVWERGIDVPGATEVWISQVQENSVALYAQSDATKPLVVDNDRDGICDSLNVDLERTKAVRHNMSPVPQGGILPPTTSTELENGPPAPLGFGPLEGTPAVEKCDLTEMTYTVSQDTPGRPTAVYAKEPDAMDTCTGISFNLGTDAGWTCVVAAAMDQSGNLGISMPIRVCRDPEDNGFCDDLPLPANLSCTDGCTMPDTSRIPYIDPYYIY